MNLAQQRALALARARRARAGATASQPAAQMPEMDAMGNPTGGYVDVAEPSMGYGEQMRNVGGAVDNGVRLLANGLTFNVADRAAGVGEMLTGKAGSYDEGVQGQRARTQGLRDAAPVTSAVIEGAGGLLGGVGMIRNGATLAGRLGSGLLPRMAAFGGEGAAYGAAHGAGATYSDDVWDYAKNAWDGAKVGFGVGAALPAAGSAVSALVRGGQSVAGPTIEGTGRTATALLRGGALADEMGLRGLQQMGPDAMLVDAGPSMLGLGQGAGTGTGQGRTELVNALRSRDAATGQRLAATLDDSLGPAPVPSQIREGLDVSRERIGAEYGRLPFETSTVDTRPLAYSLDDASQTLRGPAQTMARRVRGFLDEVPDPNAPPQPRAPGEARPLATDGRTLFETRQAIDGLLASETDPKVIRQLTMARQDADRMLADAVPGLKAADGRYAEIMRQDEALTRGGQVFDTGKTATRPVELQREIQEGALPAGEMVGPSGVPFRMRQGARAEVDRLVGTHVNDLNTLERTLATPQDWNSQKFATVFGEPQFNAVADALRNNRRMRQSYQDIVQGSQTAQRSAAQKSMDGEIDIPADMTTTGLAARSGRAVWKALVGLSNEATKDEIGRVLAKQGPDAVRVMEALLERAAATREGARSAGRAVANPAYVAAGGQYGGQRQSR